MVHEINHPELIQLIIAYTIVGAFLFTVLITCASMVGWIKLVDRAQQQRLFSVLVIQLVVVCVGFFSGFLKFTPESDEPDGEKLNATFIGYKLYTGDPGLICPEGYLNVREKYRIHDVDGEPLVKVILNTTDVRTEKVKYQDPDKNFAINHCFKEGLIRNQKIVFVSKSGRVSDVIEYVLNSKNEPIISEPAPSLSAF